MDGIVTQIARNEEIAGLPGQLPLRIGVRLPADSGVYPTGVLLTEDSNNIHQPLKAVTGEVIGCGDGTTTTFAATVAAGLPLAAGSLTITAGSETFSDDGCGRLAGDAGGSGTINYKTGSCAITTAAACSNGTDITADYITSVDGVLDVEVDTSRVNAGVAVVLGRVAADVVKVGISAPAAPSAAVIRAMRKRWLIAA